MLLSVSVSTGTQILVMTMVALIFACLGFLSPPNRGALMTAVLVSTHACIGRGLTEESVSMIRSFMCSWDVYQAIYPLDSTRVSFSGY